MTLTLSHRQPVTSLGADVARAAPNPPRSYRDERPEGSTAMLSGTPSDRARHLRLYGGPSIKSRRDDLDTSVKLFSAIAIIAGGFGLYFAGEGYVLGIPLTCAVLSMVSVGGLFGAASRRNRHDARLAEIDRLVSAAVSSSLLPGMGEAKTG
jgi:hypothetical protein